MRRRSRPMSKAQKDFIKLIEQNLNVKYKGGNSVISAASFLDKYANKNREYCKANDITTPTTVKQWVYIKDIEGVLDIKFAGTTLDEASEFIQEYVSEYHAVRRSIGYAAKLKKNLETLNKHGN